MTTTMLISYIAIGAVALVLFWRLTKRWRWSRAYERAQTNPAILNAVLWWAKELRHATYPSDPAVTPAPAVVRASNTFRASLMRVLATAYASDADCFDSDIGTGSACSNLLRDAALEAGFDAYRYFPRTHRMRIRDHHVSFTRSDGTFWECIWRKPW